jgi:hypothetical protein
VALRRVFGEVLGKAPRLEVAGGARPSGPVSEVGALIYEPGGRVMTTAFGVMALVLCVSSSCLPLSLGALGLGLVLLARG